MWKKAKKNLKADKKYQAEIDLIEKIKANLEKGISARAIDFNEELELIKYIRQLFSKEELELRVDANGAFGFTLS